MAATIAMAQASTERTSFETKGDGRRWMQDALVGGWSWRRLQCRAPKLITEALADDCDDREEEINPITDEGTLSTPENDEIVTKKVNVR